MNEKEEEDTITRRLWDKYQGIVGWGQMLGSMAYYIENQVQLAERDGAPVDAIYKNDRLKAEGKSDADAWRCVHDLPEGHTFRETYRQRVEKGKS